MTPTPPGPDEVHLWWIDLDAEDGADTDLSMEERARAERFQPPELRVRWSHARAALRRILAASTGAAPQDLTFASGLWGKPEIRRGLAGALQPGARRAAGRGCRRLGT